MCNGLKAASVAIVEMLSAGDIINPNQILLLVFPSRLAFTAWLLARGVTAWWGLLLVGIL